MDTEAIQKNEEAQTDVLQSLYKATKKQLFYSRLAGLSCMAIAAAVIITLIILIPRVITTMTNLDTILVQATDTVEEANTAIDGITEAADNMNTFITENATSVSDVMKSIDNIDFEGLNQAITDLGDVVEPLASFFNRF